MLLFPQSSGFALQFPFKKDQNADESEIRLIPGYTQELLVVLIIQILQEGLTQSRAAPL